jgi:excisionase family DNA binding protein
MLILVGPPELAGHLAQAVLRHCVQLRRDGLPVPADLAQLRDELQQRARRGLDAPILDHVPASLDAVVLGRLEVARMLRISPRQVSRMIAEGRLPRVPGVGRRVLVPASAVVELVGRGR